MAIGGIIYDHRMYIVHNVLGKMLLFPAGSSRFRSLMAGNRQPRLTFRVAEPTKEQKAYLE